MAEIKTTSGHIVKFDDADLPLVNRYRRWRSNGMKRPYAYAGRGIAMHRLIMGAVDGQFVDHINRDTLDNRRCNLRFAEHWQNSANAYREKTPKSGFKGVYRLTLRTCKARIRVKGVDYFGPLRSCVIEAAHDFDKLALEHCGEFAALNFPKSIDHSRGSRANGLPSIV